jgi:hypothetical protein
MFNAFNLANLTASEILGIPENTTVLEKQKSLLEMETLRHLVLLIDKWLDICLEHENRTKEYKYDHVDMKDEYTAGATTIDEKTKNIAIKVAFLTQSLFVCSNMGNMDFLTKLSELLSYYIRKFTGLDILNNDEKDKKYRLVLFEVKKIFYIFTLYDLFSRKNPELQSKKIAFISVLKSLFKHQKNDSDTLTQIKPENEALKDTSKLGMFMLHHCGIKNPRDKADILEALGIGNMGSPYSTQLSVFEEESLKRLIIEPDEPESKSESLAETAKPESEPLVKAAKPESENEQEVEAAKPKPEKENYLDRLCELYSLNDSIIEIKSLIHKLTLNSLLEEETLFRQMIGYTPLAITLFYYHADFIKRTLCIEKTWEQVGLFHQKMDAIKNAAILYNKFMTNIKDRKALPNLEEFSKQHNDFFADSSSIFNLTTAVEIAITDISFLKESIKPNSPSQQRYVYDQLTVHPVDPSHPPSDGNLMEARVKKVMEKVAQLKGKLETLKSDEFPIHSFTAFCEEALTTLMSQLPEDITSEDITSEDITPEDITPEDITPEQNNLTLTNINIILTLVNQKQIKLNNQFTISLIEAHERLLAKLNRTLPNENELVTHHEAKPEPNDAHEQRILANIEALFLTLKLSDKKNSVRDNLIFELAKHIGGNPQLIFVLMQQLSLQNELTDSSLHLQLETVVNKACASETNLREILCLVKEEILKYEETLKSLENLSANGNATKTKSKKPTNGFFSRFSRQKNVEASNTREVNDSTSSPSSEVLQKRIDIDSKKNALSSLTTFLNKKINSMSSATSPAASELNTGLRYRGPKST